jgi:uncharacterized protein (TIGR03435 family)
MHFGQCVMFFPVAALCLGQPASKIPADAKFEVASIKPSVPGQVNGVIRVTPGGERYAASNVSLKVMLTVAYRIRADQIVGGPGWIDSDRFDMNAKAEKPASTEALHVMLINLLSERFQLKLHREEKEMSMYALTVDKGGTKLTPHDAQNAGDTWMEQTVERMLQVKMKAKCSPMDYFAWRLSTLLNRPVTDLTNLKGEYDFDLAFTRDLPPDIPDGALVNGSPLDTAGPNIFTALRQQLGLDLTAQRGPVDVIVIDSAMKLSAN